MRLEMHSAVYAEAEGAETAEQALEILRRLPLAHFGWLLWSLPDPALPNLSRLLPRMASVDDQLLWTGSEGYALLRQSVAFANLLNQRFQSVTGRDLKGARVLDFGSGWGRMMRMMLHFSDPNDLWGVDPWRRSLDVCEADGVLGHIHQSEYLPTSLPVEGEFDLIIAFSIFTHTSEEATRTALSALRRHVRPDGVLAMTIRPMEIWKLSQEFNPNFPRERMEAEHRARGFAFTPQQVDGNNETYGETSMTLEWLADAAKGWAIVGHDISLEDPYQVVVLLQPSQTGFPG